MYQIENLDELRNMAKDAYDTLWEKAENNDRDVKIYLHWSAGHYGQFFDSYHINIDADGSIYVSTDDLSETLSHTWKRNSGSIGITLACAFGASYNTNKGLGDEPPTDSQISSMAKVISILAKELEIPINLEHVMTHGEAADNADGYWGAYGEEDLYGPENGCERWDLDYIKDGDENGTGGDKIRELALELYNKYEVPKKEPEDDGRLPVV